MISRNVYYYCSCFMPLQQTQETNSDYICEILAPKESVVKIATATASLPQNRTKHQNENENTNEALWFYLYQYSSLKTYYNIILTEARV